jgi:hypothetical protein
MPILQSIESKDLTVGELLSSFYVVPSYQREYVWKEEHVEQLLADIHDEYSSSEADSEYFIGSLVVLPHDESLFELIDGQQRLTTLFITLCAIRDCLEQLEGAAPDTLRNQISAASMTATGEEKHRYRVELQYEDSAGVLALLGAGTWVPEDSEKATRSVTNIRVAYKAVRDFLAQQFDGDAKAVRRYYAFLINRVKLIRVRTASMAHALKVFETINDRGVGLDSMDLLKNLLFMNAKQEQFDELKSIWKQLVDVLHNAKEKPLRFLRYFILANYQVDRLREDEIYTWITAHKEEVGYEAAPVAFGRELLSAARDYVDMVNGNSPGGRPNRYLANLRRLSGAARQHLILLVAARKLPDALFTELCRHVENLFFIHVITREPTKVHETDFTKWSKEVRDINSDDLRAFIDGRFEPRKAKLADRFRQALSTLTQDELQRFRLAYVLAKLTQFIELIAKGEDAAANNLDTFLNSGVQVEHILPQRPTPSVKEAFDRPAEYGNWLARLGNLTLLEKAINCSISNNFFEAKRKDYAKSSFLLTRSLGEPIGVGVNTSYTRAAKHLETFESWTSADIERRQQMLTRLAHKVWEVAEPELSNQVIGAGTAEA